MFRVLLISIGVLLTMTAISFASDIREYELDNGLKILLKENHNAPVINLNVVYRVGSKYERPGITGISHLLEHMMFKTTESLPLGEFDRKLKEVGADNNAYTWLDQTVYYELIAADKVDVALELEAGRMRGLLCLQEDHELEMPVVRNELEQRNDSPYMLLYEEMLSSAFKAHPYQVPTIGWVDDVENITAAEIKEHYDRFYQPSNAFIVATGDFDADELYSKIKAHFGPLPNTEVILPRISAEPEQRGERRFELRRAGQMDYMAAAWHIPESEHPDAYPLEVLGNILGQGRTSRLYEALVDSGLCAVAMAGSSAFGYADPFLFVVSTVMNPGVDPADVESAVYQELEKLITEGATDAELERAKKQARVSFIFEKDSIISEAKAIIDFELMSSWKRIDEYLPGVEAVTNEDLMRVAAEYLKKDNRTVGTYLAIRPQAPEMAGGPGVEGGDEDLAVTPPAYKPGTLDAPGGAAAGSTADPTEPYAEVIELDNGLTLVLKENHNNATVNINGLVPAGKINDPAELPGVGNFVVSMLSNGTTSHTKMELAEIMENAGLDIGFSPSRENFVFSGRSLTEDFELMLDLLAEQLLEPAFPEDEIVKVRQQITSSLFNSLNDTFEMSFYTGRDLIYGKKHPFAGRIDGNPESVMAITRADLQDWYGANVKPQGTVITIVGDIDIDRAAELVRDRFGDWRGAVAGREELIDRGAEFLDVAGNRETVNLPDKSSVTLTWLGAGASKMNDNWLETKVGNFVFGGDFYSRLNERLRVREGLTYGAFSMFSNGMAAGPVFLSVSVNPENVEAAIQAVNEELASISSAGITAEELTQAKNYLTGNFPVKLATNAAVAGALTDAVYLGRGTSYIQEYPELVNSLIKEQIDATLAKHLDPGNLLLVISGSIEE